LSHVSHMLLFGRWRTYRAVERTCSVRHVPMGSSLFRCVSQSAALISVHETRP